MSETKPARWRLPRGALLIALLPVAVLLGSDFLLTQHAWPASRGVPIPGPVDAADAVAAHAEAAGRIRIIAGFLIFAAAAAAATGYFAMLAFSVDRFSLASLFSAAVAIALIVVAYSQTSSPDQTQELTGQRFACAAASWPRGILILSAEQRPSVTRSSRDRAVEDIPEYCAAGRFTGLRNLVEAEWRMLFVAIPAVVFGAILCLAGPLRSKPGRSKTEEEAHKRYLQIQVNRLNTILYLSAFVMVGGLLFLSAFLHYPAFLFTGQQLAAFQKHVGALVLFYAVSYSLLIAAFYVPVAALLARECALLKHGGGTALEGSDMLAPARMMKVGAAIFSPMIVGALGEILALPT